MPVVTVSVAHLDDEEGALVLGVVLEEILAWVRSLLGTSRLRALVLADEAHEDIRVPATARSRTRARGASAACRPTPIASASSKASRARRAAVEAPTRCCKPRSRASPNAGSCCATPEGPPVLLSPRYAMSYLRGPMTRVELTQALVARRAFGHPGLKAQGSEITIVRGG